MTTAALAPRAPTASGWAPLRRAGLLAVEVLPAFAVALLLLPFIIQYGHLRPWQPSTIDLQVYVYAVKDMLAGRDIYATTSPGWGLYFIYPPIAAVLMVPLAFGQYAFWQVVWTLALVGSQQSVLRRCGVPRGWKLALVGVVAVCCVEPIRTTLGYGQVNTFLMAMVVADLLPASQGERRLLPRGTLIGLAAAIKLTPALFVVFALLLGRRRLALTVIISFVAFTAVGTILQPRQTFAFWFGLSGGNTRTASPLYVGNQSLLGVVYRLIGDDTVVTLAGMACAGLVALIATIVAAKLWRDGRHVFAVALVGLATNLASPLSWTHHFVWILPMGVAVVQELRARRTGGGLPAWAVALAGGWVVWVCLELPLALLPYGEGREHSYNALQEMVANVGPLLGVVLIVGLAARLVTRARQGTPTLVG